MELSRRGTQRPVQVSEISKEQGIPVKYLEQLIRILKQARLVKSIRGPKGGHILNRQPSEITLGQLVRLFEGQSELVVCISEPEKCAMSEVCRVRLAWMKATEALYSILDAITIEDILQTRPGATSLCQADPLFLLGDDCGCCSDDEGLAGFFPCRKINQE